MIIAHAQRAAGLGAKNTALVAILAALLVAALEAQATGGSWPIFGALAVTYVAVGLFAGAAFGAMAFGFIGFASALLGVKRVGWTFTHAIFGAAMFMFAAHMLHPTLAGGSAVFAGPAGLGAAIVLAAFCGALAGYLVSRGLKAGPDV